MPLNIDKKKLREQYSNSVSAKALTDIIGSVEYEIKGVENEKGTQQIKEDFQLIISKVNAGKNQKFMINGFSYAIVFTLFIFSFKELLKEYPKVALMMLLLSGLVSVIILNALAFEQGINKAIKDLGENIKENYPLTLNYLQNSWKPRTENTSQDSSIMQKKLVLSIIENYIEVIKLQEEAQQKNNPCPKFAPA